MGATPSTSREASDAEADDDEKKILYDQEILGLYNGNSNTHTSAAQVTNADSKPTKDPSGGAIEENTGANISDAVAAETLPTPTSNACATNATAASVTEPDENGIPPNQPQASDPALSPLPKASAADDVLAMDGPDEEDKFYYTPVDDDFEVYIAQQRENAEESDSSSVVCLPDEDITSENATNQAHATLGRERDLQAINSAAAARRAATAALALHRKSNANLLKTDASTANEQTVIEVSDRYRVFEELHQTETQYLQGLKEMCQHYCAPLDPDKGEHNIMSKSLHRQVFSNLHEIVGVNTSFLSELATVMDSWDDVDSCVGPTMSSFAPYFKCYSVYAASYASAVFLLEHEIQTNTELCEFRHDVVSTQGTSPHRLNNLLVTPVQRVPRYLLLLKELKKNTHPTHQDFPLLEDAINAITLTADLIDKNIGEGEARSKVLEIQTRFQDKVELVTRSRRFVRRGELQKLSRFGDLKLCHFFLFSDLLVWCQGPKDGPYVKPRQVSIRGIEDAKLLTKEQVKEFDRQTRAARAAGAAEKSWSSRYMKETDVVAATSKRILETLGRARSMLAKGIISDSEYRKMAELNFRLVESESGEPEKHSFIIYGKERSFWVCAPTRQEKIEWMLDVRQVLRELQKTTRAIFSHNDDKLMAVLESNDDQLSPVFTPNHFSNVCSICIREFGVMQGTRRHHCRACGALVCAGCSRGRQKIHGKMQRVCNLCESVRGEPSKEGTFRAHAPDGSEIIDEAAEALKRGEITESEYQSITRKAAIVDAKRLEAQQSHRASFLGMQQAAKEEQLSAAIVSRIQNSDDALLNAPRRLSRASTPKTQDNANEASAQ